MHIYSETNMSGLFSDNLYKSILIPDPACKNQKYNLHLKCIFKKISGIKGFYVYTSIYIVNNVF